jgi:DNA replication protein DnaC
VTREDFSESLRRHNHGAADDPFDRDPSPPPLRVNKRETFDRLKFTLGGAGERTDGHALTAAKSLDFKAIPKLNKMQVLELARCDWIERRENVIALGPSGTGKTHVALGLGLAACQKGMTVSFTTAAALVNELMEARDERRLLRVQKQMANAKLLIIDELGFVPLSKTGAELLFELISQRYERGATLITSNLPFDEWTETFGTERLTGALLDRLTHHVNILEMNGESYRLAASALCALHAQPQSGLLLRRPLVGFYSAVDRWAHLRANRLAISVFGFESCNPNLCRRSTVTASVTTGRAAHATPGAPRAASYTNRWDTASHFPSATGLVHGKVGSESPI